MLLAIPINLLTEAIWPWTLSTAALQARGAVGSLHNPASIQLSAAPLPLQSVPGDGPQTTINSSMFYKVIILTRKIDYFKIILLKNRNHSFTTGLKQFFHTCGIPYFQYGSVDSNSQWVLWFH